MTRAIVDSQPCLFSSAAGIQTRPGYCRTEGQLIRRLTRENSKPTMRRETSVSGDPRVWASINLCRSSLIVIQRLRVLESVVTAGRRGWNVSCVSAASVGPRVVHRDLDSLLHVPCCDRWNNNEVGYRCRFLAHRQALTDGLHRPKEATSSPIDATRNHKTDMSS